MKINHKTIEFQTKEELDFIDFTQEAQKFVAESNIQNGLLNIQTLHTTCLLLLNENEPLLLRDFKKHLSMISPKDIGYEHDDLSKRTVNVCQDECINGHSHCKAVHLPSNLVLNIIDNKLQLGQWQRVFLIELDRARIRNVQLQIIGE
ncbi:MAG: secondary thiamine-phosphate synthase enzyme YjbQ [Candidatus Nealsonbacteria bacterium]|nr:secondary thiamine-phosphate synthase enzyme YjbQ [Candidatus Nealsonbacteria bacterium]